MAHAELLRKSLVLKVTASSASKLYADINNGVFVKPVKIGARASAWPASEVAVINAARVAGKSPDEIRALVDHLHAQRACALDEALAAA